MNANEPSPSPMPAAKSTRAPVRIDDTAVTEPAIPTTPLTPEEQMALFEKELKETDWGHQPC